MINFERYPHINDLIKHYIEALERTDMESIFSLGVSSESEALQFAHFIWLVAEKINEDEELGNIVMGSKDNIEMIPDLSYEATKYMRKSGFYSVWEKVSAQEME